LAQGLHGSSHATSASVSARASACMAEDLAQGPGLADEQDEDIPPEFECSICMKLLLDPVTVSCGHTFCRVCLEKSLGYRGLCAVCRAPIAAGQGVNILIRSILAERFPRALAHRHSEAEEELRANELEADEARRREALGADPGAAAPAANGAAGAAPVLPLLEGPSFAGTVLLPHCAVELELRSEAEERLVEFALQGGRRLGVIDGAPGGAFDDAARPLGICLEVGHIQRGTTQRRTVVRLVGKFRFWLAEAPQLHENGFALGRCEAFFDEALPVAELTGAVAVAGVAGAAAAAEEDVGAAGEEPPEPRATARQVAMVAMALLEAQLIHVGHGGRRIFEERFGDVPSAPAAGQPTTSAVLERLSFFLLGAMLTEAHERRQWLGSTDTRARLEHCRARLEAAGRRPALNLPGASSWMQGQSAFSSFALLVAIIAIFVAKALGFFDSGGGGFRRGAFREHEGNMQEAMAFGQLLR